VLMYRVDGARYDVLGRFQCWVGTAGPPTRALGIECGDSGTLPERMKKGEEGRLMMYYCTK
jgi:hypothetical protein